ncbi:MAG: CRISPR-associated protein Cas5 [Clostridia bacterium]|nr:CRISPR-associated protein Cas5 [Clostridia bacterium]
MSKIYSSIYFFSFEAFLYSWTKVFSSTFGVTGMVVPPSAAIR